MIINSPTTNQTIIDCPSIRVHTIKYDSWFTADEVCIENRN